MFSTEINLKKEILKVTIALLLIIILTTTQTKAETIYTNQQHPNCNDQYNRTQAINPNTPFCSINTGIQKIQSGDTLLVQQGVYRNTTGTIINRQFTNQTNIQAQNAIITSSYEQLENTPNQQWIIDRPETNTWKTNTINSISNSVGCYYKDQQLPLYPYNSEIEFYNPNNPEGTHYQIGTLKIRLEQGKNPNNIPLECHTTTTLSITNSKNIKLSGFTIKSGNKNLYIEDTQNIIITQNNFTGGLTDTGTIDTRTNQDLTITKNIIERTEPNWNWEQSKYGTNTETSAIWNKNNGRNNIIKENKITGYFNGIVLYTDQTGYFPQAQITHNNITNASDDSIEIEDYANAYNITQNHINNYFVAFSLAPADSTQNTSYIYDNKITNRRLIQFTDTEIANGRDFKTITEQPPLNFQINNNNANVIIAQENLVVENETIPQQNQTNTTILQDNTTIEQNQQNNTQTQQNNTDNNQTTNNNTTPEGNYLTRTNPNNQQNQKGNYNATYTAADTAPVITDTFLKIIISIGKIFDPTN